MRNIPTLALGVLMSAAFIGCDEKVAEKKTVDVKSDGTTVTKKDTVTKEADGTVVEKKTKDVDKPADADHDGAKIKIDVDKK